MTEKLTKIQRVNGTVVYNDSFLHESFHGIVTLVWILKGQDFLALPRRLYRDANLRTSWSIVNLREKS